MRLAQWSAKNEKNAIALLIFLVLLSRMPFIFSGYGTDADAWRVMNASYRIAHEHRYIASRLPGSPLTEYLYAYIGTVKPFVVNGLTASMSVVAILFFALILRKLGIRQYYITVLAMAFTPVFYINSTTSMDYVWAESFALCGFYFLLVNKPVIAGILLGLAVGARITSCLFLLPLLIISYPGFTNKWKGIIYFCVATLGTSILFYLPIIRICGFKFLILPEYEYPNILVVLYKFTADVWGIVGCAAIFIALVYNIKSISNKIALYIKKRNVVVMGSLLAICIFIALYFKLPHEAGYLIPIIPFFLIILNYTLPEKSIYILCSSLVVSSFIFGLDFNGLHVIGNVFLSSNEREHELVVVNEIIRFERSIGDNNVFVVGKYLPKIENYLTKDSIETRKYLYGIDYSDLVKLKKAGVTIYFYDENNFNYRHYNLQLTQVGIPIPIGAAQ